jgi:translation elongation factor EF-Tu-like GTPase
MFRFAVSATPAFARASVTAALPLLDGVMPQTREHVVLARQVGVSHIVVALDTGQTFAIREGGRTVGAGTVTAVLD